MKNSTKVYFLDFDGVIVESASIKTQAFYDLFLPFGEDVAKKALDYHLEHQGISRFKKFTYVGEEVLGKSFTEQEQQNLSSRFSEIVIQKILVAPFVPGVESFLKNTEEKVQKFVLSATPENELVGICRARGIDNCFDEIRGTPKTKQQIGIELLNQYQINPGNVVFIGDSIQDYKAACELGTHFIGRTTEGEENPFPNAVRTMRDFREL